MHRVKVQRLLSAALIALSAVTLVLEIGDVADYIPPLPDRQHDILLHMLTALIVSSVISMYMRSHAETYEVGRRVGCEQERQRCRQEHSTIMNRQRKRDSVVEFRAR